MILGIYVPILSNEVEIYSDADFNNLVYRYQSDVSSTSHHASHGADNFDDSLGTCGENGFQDASNCNLQYGGTDYWWRVRVRFQGSFGSSLASSQFLY